MMLDSIDAGPLVYPTVVGEDGQTRPKKYSELTEAQQLQDDYDVQATNIILHGPSTQIVCHLSDHQATKILGRVKLLMKALNDHIKNVMQILINDMHTIRMTMQQVQVNTKFLNALLPEWSKFITDVKLAKSLYTTNYDQLYAYLSQHERHANEEKIRLTASTKQWHSYMLWHQGFHPQTINSERLPIPEIMQPFKMEESQFNKFKEDKLRVLLALETKELLQPQWETMQQDVHEMSYSEQTHIVDCPDIEITSDSNIIPHS
ncbi:hypothetical protein Tco_0767597 [Tanacetum coccineum]